MFCLRPTCWLPYSAASTLLYSALLYSTLLRTGFCSTYVRVIPLFVVGSDWSQLQTTHLSPLTWLDRRWKQERKFMHDQKISICTSSRSFLSRRFLNCDISMFSYYTPKSSRFSCQPNSSAQFKEMCFVVLGSNTTMLLVFPTSLHVIMSTYCTVARAIPTL